MNMRAASVKFLEAISGEYNGDALEEVDAGESAYGTDIRLTTGLVRSPVREKPLGSHVRHKVRPVAVTSEGRS